MVTITCGSECEALATVLRPASVYQLAACPNCIDAMLVDFTADEPRFMPLAGIERMDAIAPAGSVMAGIFRTLDETIQRLPVLPHVTQRVLATIHDPLLSMTDLATVINEDATISVKVLKVANSAFYASAHEIKDLHVACARLGLKTVANIVNTAANSDMYRSNSPAFRDAMQRLWRHAVATAHCADKIALELPGDEHRSAFMAGLVHDIGKLVLLDILSSKYSGNVGRLKDSPQLLTKVLDLFAPIVGLHVVQFWKLPPEFAFSTFYSARPHLVPVEEWRSLAELVCLATAMADALGHSVQAPPSAPREISDSPDAAENAARERVLALVNHPSARALSLTPQHLARIHEKADAELQALLDVFAAL